MISLYHSLVDFIKIELCSRYVAHKPNQDSLPLFAMYVVEHYIVSADSVLISIQFVTWGVSFFGCWFSCFFVCVLFNLCHM